jgi:hypothetical protein
MLRKATSDPLDRRKRRSYSEVRKEIREDGE